MRNLENSENYEISYCFSLFIGRLICAAKFFFALSCQLISFNRLTQNLPGKIILRSFLVGFFAKYCDSSNNEFVEIN